MAHFEEKAKLVEHVTPHFTWSQTVQEVHIKIALPVGTRGRNVICEIKPKSIKFQVKGQEPILDGELFGNINHKESIWSLEPESGEVFIILHKTKKHETWESVVKGFYELDLLTKEEMGKKMMLEKFQSEVLIYLIFIFILFSF